MTQSEKYEGLKSITVPAKDYKFPVREFKQEQEYADSVYQMASFNLISTVYIVLLYSSLHRSFTYSWIGKYPGLTYSISQDGAYCLFCLLFVCDKNEHAGNRTETESMLQSYLMVIILTLEVTRSLHMVMRHIRCVQNLH